MSRERAALGALAMAGFVVTGAAVEWVSTDGRLALDAWIDLVAGWVLAGAGIAAWLSAPRSRIGPLLMAAAAAWFLGTLISVTSPIGRTEPGRLAWFLIQCHAGFLVQAIATWPSGRITRPTQLVVVVGGWIAALFPQLWVDSPGYIVLGVLLAGGLTLDQRSLTPARRSAYRPARNAGLLLAVGMAIIPGLAQALKELDLAVVASGFRLWAATVAAVGVILAQALIDRQRHGAVADLAVRLQAGDLVPPGGDLGPHIRDATAVASADDAVLREVLTQVTALTARNRALGSELAGRVRELEASRRRLIEVGDEECVALVERLRLGAGSRLAVLEADLALLTRTSGEPASVSSSIVGVRLARALDQSRAARDDLDALALGLDPGRVGERGLDAALRDLAAGSPFPVEVSLADGTPAGRSVAAALYFVASEGLANVTRHARARTAWLRIHADASGWRLAVEDDGVGGADPARGSGLRGLQERLDAFGGRLLVRARPGGGTLLEATIPAAGLAAASAPGGAGTDR